MFCFDDESWIWRSGNVGIITGRRMRGFRISYKGETLGIRLRFIAWRIDTTLFVATHSFILYIGYRDVDNVHCFHFATPALCDSVVLGSCDQSAV